MQVRAGIEPDVISDPASATWRWVEIPETIGVAALVALAAWASMAMNGPLNFAIFWPANGVLLGFLLTSPRRRWPQFLLAGFIASLLVHIAYRYELKGSLVMSVANSIEVLIAALPFARAHDIPPDLTRPRSLLRFSIVSLSAPLFSGLFAVGVLGVFLPGTDRLTLFRGWYAGDALGLILTTPVMLAVLRKESLDLFRLRKLPETLLLFATLVGPNLLLTEPRRLPLMFVEIPILVLVVFRLGLPGAAIGVVLMSIPITHFAATGSGIFSLRVYAQASSRVLLLQAYFFIQLAMAYLISAVLAERRRLLEALQHSEERYRGMAEHSWDIIVRASPQGIREYVSPSVLETTGWRAEELVGSDFRREVHPADFEKVDTLMRRLIAGEDKEVMLFRMERKDAGFLWMETKGRAVKDPTTGELKELIAVMRDVSARVARDEALKDAYDLAETRALTDGLTGLGNRRSFDEILELEWKRSDDEKTQLSLLMIDADHFKHYNDSYGHQSGDACLCTIAGIIGNCIRQHHDFAARYGGEEFAVILPNTNPAGALAIAERLRETVATHPMEPELDPKRRLTVSIGVATGGSAIAGTVEWTARDLLHGADMALYEAKRTGRNRVCIHAGQSH